MRLVFEFPEPYAASLFTQDAEGWELVTWPGEAAPRPAPWTALPGGGAIAFTVPAGDTTTFFAAPRAFLVARPEPADRLIALRMAAGAGATLRSDERSIVLVGGTAAVALDVSWGIEHDHGGVVIREILASVQEDGTILVRAPVSAFVGWTDVATGEAAGDDLLGSVVADLRALLVSPRLLAPAEGATAAVELRTAEMYVCPSPPAAVHGSAADDVLRQLLNRLVRDRPAPGSVSLDGASLPPGVPGAPDRVLAVLRDALAVDGLTVVVAADPAVSGGKMVLAGTADVAGAKDAAVRAEFTVDDALHLQMVLQVDLPAGWMMADGFAELATTPFATMPLMPATLQVATWPHSVDGAPFPLRPGLNLAATYTVTPELRVALDPAAEGTVPIAFGGPVQRTPSLRFALSGTGRLPDLALSPPNAAPLSFTDGMALLSYAVDDAGNVTASAVLNGRTTLAKQTVDAVLDLPTLGDPAPVLRIVEAGLALPRLADAMAQVAGGLDTASLFPPTLLELGGLAELTVGFTWDPTLTRATKAFLEARSADWTFAPGLSLQRPTVVLEVTHPPRGGMRTFSGYAMGILQLGTSLSVAAAAGFTSGRRWYVTLQDRSAAPSMETLASLLGTQRGGLIPPLPKSLSDQTDLATPTQVYFGGDPFAGKLEMAGFRFAQRQPWMALPGVTISDFSVAVTATNGPKGWAATGRLQGSVTLGTGRDAASFHVEMPIPPRPGEAWTICLDEASAIRIPTLRQVLNLAGGTAVPLPDGLATLGGLDVTALTLAFNPAADPDDPAGPSLLHLGLRFKQDGEWTIIPGPPGGAPALAARGLSASLSVRTNPLAALGRAEGVVTVLGTEMDFSLYKPTFDGGWELRAGWSQPVHVPGLADLADWMGRDGARGVLAAVPLFGQGFDLGSLRLRFAGDTGRLLLVGFRLSTPQVWSVVGDKLSVTDLYADLLVPTQGVPTGSLGGVVTVAGVAAQLRAARPTERDPWTFTGRLWPPMPMSLLDAANQVSETALALPADSQSLWNLPTPVLRSADVTAVPQTGAYTLTAALATDSWSIGFGAAMLTLRGLSGRVERAGTDAPLVAQVLGQLSFASLDLRLGMQIGTTETDTVLTGTVTPEAVRGLEVGTVADRLAGAAGEAKWGSIVPDGLPSALSGVSATLDLTRGVFLLTGTLAGFASAFFLGRRVAQGGGEEAQAGAGTGRPAGSASKKATETGNGTDTALDYLFAAALGEDFTFGRLLPGLAPVDDVIRVQDASLAVYSVGSRGIAGLGAAMASLTGLPPMVRWPLPDAATTRVPARSGVVLTATVRLHTSALFDRVLEVGTVGGDTLRVMAVIDRTDTSNSLFRVRLPDIAVLQTITLANGDVTFRPGDNERLTVSADLLFQEIFGRSLGFRGEMVLTADRMSGTLRLPSPGGNPSIDGPFGIPGISVQQLRAEVDCAFGRPGPPPTPKSWRLSLRGTARLGRPPAHDTKDERAMFAARVTLRDGVPALLAVDVGQDLPVGCFLAQTLTGEAAAWPSEFIGLTFRAGSRVYYYDAAADPAPAQWASDPASGALNRDGFHVDGVVELTLMETLSLRFTLDVVRRDGRYVGVTASAGLTRPVDLLFISLAGQTLRGDAYVSGPSLALTTVAGAPPSFGFEAGINFLGRALVAGKVQVSRSADGGTQVDGQVSTAGAVNPFHKVAFDFTYARTLAGQSRFQLRNWPGFSLAQQIIDIAAEIRKIADAAASTGACGSVAGLVTNALLETKYTITPTADSDGDVLVFGMVVSCRMRIRGAPTSFLTSALPPVQVRVPRATRFEDLLKTFVRGIAETGPEFARSLLDNPKDLSLFLAMTSGQAGMDIALGLSCRGLTNGAVPAAIEAAASAISAAGGAAAVTAAKLAAITATISSIISGGAWGGPGSGGSGGGPGTIAVGRPELVEARWAGRHVHARWTVVPDAAGYELQLASGGAVLHTVDVGRTDEGDLALDAAALVAGTYEVTVVARRGVDRAVSNSLPVVKLAKPAVSLTYVDGTLTAAASGEGDAFRIRICRGDGTLLSQIQVPSSARSSSVADSSPGTRQYTAAAEALRAGAIPSGMSDPTTLTVPPVPQGLTLLYDAGTGAVLARWTALPTTLPTYAYGFELLGSDGTHAAPTRSGLTKPEARVFGEAFQPGQTYRGRVRAERDGNLGPWSEPVQVIIGKPLFVRELNVWCDVATGGVTASWTGPDADPHTYRAQVVQSGAILAEVPAAAPPLKIPEVAFAVGTPCTVRVCVTTAATQGPWVAADFTPIPAPAGLAAHQVGTRIEATWQEVVGATSYELRLVAGGAPVGAPTAGTTGLAGGIDMPQGAAAGTTYAVQVRAVTYTQHARSAWSPAVNALPLPAGPAPLHLPGAAPPVSANAWILLLDDNPRGSSYKTPGSSYQNLVTHGVYGYTDLVSVGRVSTVSTGPATVPPGDGSTYTIQLQAKTHPDGSTNQQYLEWLVQDARRANPTIKILAMLCSGAGEITRIFSPDRRWWHQNARDYANNLVAYLQHHDLDGFDVAWKSPLSSEGTPEQFAILFTAIRTAFNSRSRYYYLTLSPESVGTLDASTVNAAFDFVNLQLFSGRTSADDFVNAGVSKKLLAYGARFEQTGGIPFQSAWHAYRGYVSGGYTVATQWRLNSDNFLYEQAQQMILHQLVHGRPGTWFNDGPIIGAAGNPPISQLLIRAGDVLDAMQATNTGTFSRRPVQYVLPQHGGSGGVASRVDIPSGDVVAEVSGSTGSWRGQHCVLQITITTRGGRVLGTFGSMENSTSKVPFRFVAPPGKSIVAFSGTVVNVPRSRTDVVASLQVSYA